MYFCIDFNFVCVTLMISTKRFEDIPVSTKTYIASSNTNIDIYGLYDYLNTTPYKIQEKKRGRRRKDAKPPIKQTLSKGSIVTVKCEHRMKGVDLSPRKNNKTNSWFRNALTIVIFIDKFINFKVCKNGTFQFTGCKNIDHAIYCIDFIKNTLRENNLFTYKEPSIHDIDRKLVIYLIPTMRNIDFDIGFKIDRQKLYNTFSNNPDLFCLLEASFGYTGVNVKIPIDKDISSLDVIKYTCHIKSDIVDIENVKYNEYLNTLDDEAKKKKMKQKYNTFLIFHSGKIIFSGISSEIMKNTYYTFVDQLMSSYDIIKETLIK